MRKFIFISLATAVFIIILFAVTNYFFQVKKKDKKDQGSGFTKLNTVWVAPDTNEIANSPQGDLIRYGKNLILHTANFFGPNGSIAQSANGMNCGNCHIEGGTKTWGDNFSMVATTYPLFRSRSGKIETVEMRINDCFERSLNGEKLLDSTKEMKAMVAYINWVGKDVAKGTKIKGAGIEKLPFLKRAADTMKGKLVYISICQKCHGKNGEGILENNEVEYLYPPLWGKHSYNVGAGIYQLSKFAGFIKNNMPFGTTYMNPQLTNEQAWDVAAFVNTMPRPLKDLKNDWPDLSKKPFDYPYGPYTDTFSSLQHKYGPYGQISKP